MDRKQFTVIRGGLSDRANTSRKEFISAYVTDTRLMGVLGMYIHFSLPENPTMRELHQFFYFDAEEYGFESYQSILGNHPSRQAEIENSLIGGLGGQKIDLTLREAQALLQEYTQFNKEHQIPLPEGYDEYGFLLQNFTPLDELEQYMLMDKTCIFPRSDYELINYYLMRVFGRDFVAADHLADQDLDKSKLPTLSMGTFLRNIIDKDKEDHTYLCESLVEVDDNYYIVITSITVEGAFIADCKQVSILQISPSETAMMLSRSEFVTVYDAAGLSDFSPKAMLTLKKEASVSQHDTGKLYMFFHPDNDHVNQREYRLNEDVAGLCYFTDRGQIICAAYSLRDIFRLERKIESLIQASLPTKKTASKEFHQDIPRYEFQEPVVYEYIQSGFDDFHEFVEAIKTWPE